MYTMSLALLTLLQSWPTLDPHARQPGEIVDRRHLCRDQVADGVLRPLSPSWVDAVISGMTIDQARALLGRPDIEVNSTVGGHNFVLWRYNRVRMAIWFSRGDDGVY